MVQSVELLLDTDADAIIRGQWAALAAVGLPSEQRSPSDLFHRPHVTLYAADRISPEADLGLPALLPELDLSIMIGPVLIFGPRHGRSILVRTVVPSEALLQLQARVADLCGAEPEGQFSAGRWSPHVTVARRMPTDQLGRALEVLGSRTTSARITGVRRWDGTVKRAWAIG
ncbi:MAG TPA: 2'-5' RNA ligase family protein [Microlunatus sp.]